MAALECAAIARVEEEAAHSAHAPMTVLEGTFTASPHLHS